MNVSSKFRWSHACFQDRIPLVLCSLLLFLAAESSNAARSSTASLGVEEETRRHRSSRGPRGSHFPKTARRRLQEDMGVPPLSEGYGGAGAQGMNRPIPNMQVQIVPASPTATPLPTAVPAPTPDPRNITFLPGALTVMEQDLLLSQGLTSTLFAVSGMPVRFADGTTSDKDFHDWPDGAACFVDDRPGNEGGWIYVSNVEDKDGGVGAITFNSNGEVIDYKMLLTDTIYNCNGGRTPWGTWISAEEDYDKERGRPWQVDPYGIRPPATINMGLAGGIYEAFAYDVRIPSAPRFFLTEDFVFGALERFTPLAPNWTDPWTILEGVGVNEWLLLTPNPTNSSFGTYSWTTDLDVARSNAALNYPESEGIDVSGSNLFFVCKGIKMLFTLDLDGNTYTRHTTDNGLFEGEPDMIRTILSEEEGVESLLYFTEDNGRRAGVHARNQAGELVTILEGFYSPETTGLALSPNGMFMYVCFQEDGYCFAISRTDGFSFGTKTLNVKRHSTEGGSKENTRKTKRERQRL